MRGSFGDRPGAAAGPPVRLSPARPRSPAAAVAASAFAGFLGAGVVDLAAILTRVSGAPARPIATLALGIYGTLGLCAAAVAWAVVRATLGALPGGARRLVDDVVFDGQLTAALFASVGGAVVLALGAAAAQGLFLGHMASRQLAVIATFGITLALVPIAAVAAFALRRPARAVAGLIPRPRWLPRTALVLLLLAAGGVLAGLAALSRADWRVLDLGWLEAAALALVLGLFHGLFWYVTRVGRRIQARLPVAVLRGLVAAAVIVLLVLAAGVPEGDPAYQAVDDGAIGLRSGLKMARTLTDRDGDGFSARFGGGDCDDHRADVFPGAEDKPGDGIDQDCQGGDAQGEAAPPVAATPPEPAVPLKPVAGAFKGNLLLISIDALRADRLGVAGYGRPAGHSLTPTLDGLARRGAYFRRVWSQAPNTPRSFPSLVTSRYPSDIAWQQRSLNYSPILPSNRTFFELLSRGGWKPIGIFSHFYFTADRGLSKAFAEWSNDDAGTIAESNKDIAAPRIVPRVVARLAKAAADHERFVLWTHLFEPHSSYMEHPEFPTSLRGVAGLEEKYDYEIAFVDRWLGKIIAALAETGLDKNTTVVIWADHGEAWGEHKRFFHGQDLTEEQLRVPLIIAVPGLAPVTVDDEVALVDVGATLLDLVGLPVPGAFRGRSLVPRLRGKPLPVRPVFAELLPATAWPHHEVMMVERGRKLTHRISDRRWDLHDLRTDPKQLRNLADDPRHHRLFEQLKSQVLRFEEGKR
jgi:arylsulfatase A-like enzyme